MTDASVNLWGRRIGAVSWDEERAVGVFQYAPAFLSAGVEVSPLVMPVREAPYAFTALSRETFMGLPGLLADALPDRFGNRLIDVWLAETGRTAREFNPVDRLCYMGTRATGALEFEPAIRHGNRETRLEIAQLVDLADRVLNERLQLNGRLDGRDDGKALENILSVGTSAGGARAKAVLAWNPKTGEFRSGQVDAPDGFEHWILKFDGVSSSRDREVADPRGFGRIEYAYYLMAIEAGIEMSGCRLHHEGGRSHFMTRRFDRDEKGRKVHMQSLGALQHYDFNDSGAYAYEQAILTIRALGLGMPAVEEQFRRALFNVVARNQDDHVKNISFLMNRRGEWRLSPAYDVAYAYNPSGSWTRNHQMRLAGKRDDFTRDDVLQFARSCGLKKHLARRILDQVASAVGGWRGFAADAGVEPRDIERIERTHRTRLWIDGRATSLHPARMSTKDALGPFQAGDGGLPPYLAGREYEQEICGAFLSRLRNGRPPPREIVFHGPRGNGKTALLAWLRKEVAAVPGVDAIRLVPVAIRTETKLVERLLPSSWWQRLAPSEVSLYGIRWRPGQDRPPPLDEALAARSARKPLVLLLDEAHTLTSEVGGALLNASQQVGRELPFLLVLAGTPELRSRLGSFDATFWNRAERLPIGRLEPGASAAALQVPLQREGIAVDADATACMVGESQGYPYFVQLWGEAIWSRIRSAPRARRRAALEDVDGARAIFNRRRDGYYLERYDELMERNLLPVARTVAEVFRERSRLSDADLDTAIVRGLGEADRSERVAGARTALAHLGYVWRPETEPTWEAGIPSLTDYVRRYAPAPVPGGGDRA